MSRKKRPRTRQQQLLEKALISTPPLDGEVSTELTEAAQSQIQKIQDGKERGGTLYAHPEMLTQDQLSECDYLRDDIVALHIASPLDPPGDPSPDAVCDVEFFNEAGSCSVSFGSTRKFRQNWDAIFGGPGQNLPN